jgi:hypothetical protein
MGRADDEDDDEDFDDELAEPEPIWIGRTLELTYDGAFWSGDLRLRSLDKLVKGRSKDLLLEIESDDGTLSKTVRRGLAWLLANQAAVGKVLVAGLVAGYPAIRAHALKIDIPDAKKLPAEAAFTAKTLAKFVDAAAVTVHETAYGPKPYVGVQLRAVWEREHGLGVLLHGTRIVAIGDADVALDIYGPATDRRKQRAKRKPAKAKPKAIVKRKAKPKMR